MTAPVSNGASGRALEHLDFEISARVARAARVRRLDRGPNDPMFRPLRVFALDQSAGVLEGATATLNVPYERLKPGPAGALIRVIDDGLAGLIGERLPSALDLDNSLVLIGQGRAPSATDPDFRAQMAHAVCSATYAAFRRALGRAPSWGFDSDGEHTQLVVRSCVAGLRNAEYSSARGEIRLGAFLANDTVTGRNAPRQPVCTALSHDLIVHEMTHGDTGARLATVEQMLVHVDMAAGRSTPILPDVAAALDAVAAAHAALPIPPEVGRVMRLPASRPAG